MQELEHAVRQRVRLRNHRRTRLLQHLRTGQVRRFLGEVRIDDPAAGLSWHRGGHNDWTGNMAICQEKRRRCVVFLGNSVRAELIYPELAQFILGQNTTPWWWHYDR